MKTDVSADIEAAEAFFREPDRRRPFRAWLGMYLQDVFGWDAGSIYLRRNNAGDAIALEVVDGTTIIPLADYFGRVPMDENDADAEPGDELDGETVPAYVQEIMGMPWTWLSATDLIYQPLNPVPESQYGLAPLEKILITGNTDVRFQLHFLNFFTDGSLPGGFMEAPPDMSDPAQLQEWQDVWDALMIGDQAMLRQIRWVPSGSKFTPTKNNGEFDEKFPLYLMRRCCAAYGVTPSDIGFTDQVNKATGDTQIDVQFRVGTRPALRHVEDILSLFAQRDLGLRVKLQIDDGREVEDRVATAQAHSIYIQSGVESADEVRDEIGKPTDKTQAVSRFIQTRQGITMLETLLGQTKNPIDPETFAPSGKVEYAEPAPAPVPPPGKPPAPGAPAAAGASEQAAASDATPAGEKPAIPGGQDAANTNTSPVAKAETAGITAATGIQGSDLLGRDDDDEDDEDDEDDLDDHRAPGRRRFAGRARGRTRRRRDDRVQPAGRDRAAPRLVLVDVGAGIRCRRREGRRRRAQGAARPGGHHAQRPDRQRRGPDRERARRRPRPRRQLRGDRQGRAGGRREPAARGADRRHRVRAGDVRGRDGHLRRERRRAGRLARRGLGLRAVRRQRERLTVCARRRAHAAGAPGV